MGWDDNGPDYDEDDDFDRHHTPYTRTKTSPRRSVLNVPERQQRKTWNGTPVASMDSDHIMNSILFCERKFSDAKTHYEKCYGLAEEFYFQSVENMFPEYANLREEWFKRLKA